MVNLDNIPKKEFFNVPDGYFEKLPDEIFTRISMEKKMVFRRKIWMTASAVAAVAIILLGISFFFMNLNKNNVTTIVKTEENQTDTTLNQIEFAKLDTSHVPSIVQDEEAIAPPTSSRSAIHKSSENKVVTAHEEIDFCSFDMQIIEYYSEDIVSNEYYELK